MTQKVLRVGTSAAVTIPKESLKTLGLKVGDRITVTIDETRKAITIAPTTRISPEDAKIAKLTLRFINRYRLDLLALAKK